MIITALISLASVIIGLVISVFPTSTGLPTEVTAAITTLSGYVGILDPLVPISTLAQALSVILLYELTIFTFRGTLWVYSKIPFLGK